MTQERYAELMNDDSKKLTPEELAEGWHFCWEWDGLLYGPDMPQSCGCGHYVAAATPPRNCNVEGHNADCGHWF